VKRPALILAAVAVVQFMVSLDLSVVNVGLPRIAGGLGFSAVGVTWVINAYALTFGGLLLVGGKAADGTAISGSCCSGSACSGWPPSQAASPRSPGSSSLLARCRASEPPRLRRPRWHC
jgi:MFS family permease